jgi:hypothetical protein
MRLIVHFRISVLGNSVALAIASAAIVRNSAVARFNARYPLAGSVQRGVTEADAADTASRPVMPLYSRPLEQGHGIYLHKAARRRIDLHQNYDLTPAPKDARAATTRNRKTRTSQRIAFLASRFS